MKNVVIGILGSVLDRHGKRDNRWKKWRPTVSICQHADMPVDRLELLFDNHSATLAEQVREDIQEASPETEVVFHRVNFTAPWDFESVYSELLDFSRGYRFKPQQENYFIHITTGTHVAQICLYLLTESGYLPGKLLQTSPGNRNGRAQGRYQVIDLDLSKYDQIASRFNKEHYEGTVHLKGGIETSNAAFNEMIGQLEKVSLRSDEPVLLTGPTGAGKSQLARRIYELRKQRSQLKGSLVVVNCATLRGDNAMSALFGHKKGAFTGAVSDRAGLLREADNGLLFLDEVGELGLDEQAMLLSAIEDKQFLPFGSDKLVRSNFQLITGTNRDLSARVQQGAFRADLLARIDLWTYRLPPLKERLEDLEPNLDYELESFAAKTGFLVSFNKTAKAKYLQFGQSSEALWSANFRDLNASVIRMATLSDGGRINESLVAQEIRRLKGKWQSPVDNDEAVINGLIPAERLAEMDLFERIQLNGVIKVCQQSRSMAEAGRKLFNQSRRRRTSKNDSHRIKQFLDRYHVSFEEI